MANMPAIDYQHLDNLAARVRGRQLGLAEFLMGMARPKTINVAEIR
jgi:hypothetical protein